MGDINDWLKDLEPANAGAEAERRVEEMLGEIRKSAMAEVKDLPISDAMKNSIVDNVLLRAFKRSWKLGFTGGVLYCMGSFKKRMFEEGNPETQGKETKDA